MRQIFICFRNSTLFYSIRQLLFNFQLQVVKMRLELLEDEGRAKAVLMKLVEKDRLMEWLITGAGLLRNVVGNGAFLPS